MISNLQPGQAGTHAVVGSAATGTALGAAAGAAIGGATGNAAAGAAIGAATGLLGGTAVGANNATVGQFNLQRRYDIGYTQCMYSYGNTVEAPPATYLAYGSPYPYWPPWYGSYGPGFSGADIFVFRGSHRFHHWMR
ncbi:MAG TPA: glycine zipper family protein [Steroidobacteraceae bacterium]